MFGSSYDAKLPAMGADPDSLTFLGFSSGSFASTLMQVSHSSTIKASGLISGGAYAAGTAGMGNVIQDPDNFVSDLVAVAEGFEG